jgi:aspartate-semialdehyde dehydrogenase
LAEIIALVGGDTLLGREVREVAGETAIGHHLRLVAGDEEEIGRITEIAGEPAFVTKLDPDAVADAAVVILAGSPESSKEALTAESSALIVDLTYILEDDPAAHIRAPQIEGPDYEPDHSGPQIVAHPAAIAIAVILKRLGDAALITRAVVQIFEPASERGKRGIDELQQQTVNLLSFQPLPKKVFDAQLSFSLLAQLGPEAPVSLQDVEDRIERHLATLLERLDREDRGIPMPSLRVIQAPVFHGYSFSFWVEFEDAPSLSDLEDALNRDPLELQMGETEAPNNVGIAGQSGISIGALSADRNCGNAIWLWAAVDNLRISAENATMIAGEVV